MPANCEYEYTRASYFWFPASELCVVCGLCGMLSVDLWSASILDARWSADLHILYDGMMKYGVSIMVSITITDMKRPLTATRVEPQPKISAHSAQPQNKLEVFHGGRCL